MLQLGFTIGGYLPFANSYAASVCDAVDHTRQTARFLSASSPTSPLVSGSQITLVGKAYACTKADLECLLEAKVNLSRPLSTSPQTEKAWMCIHGSLWCNLCGTVKHADDLAEVTRTKAVLHTCGELDIGGAMGVGVVVHCGSCTNKKIGMERMAASLRDALITPSPLTAMFAREEHISTSDVLRRRKIYLENSAGEGTKLGSTLEEMSDILKLVDPSLQSQISICWDTAHSYGSGTVDFSQPDNVIQFFESPDAERIKLIHLNDSAVKFGSHVDRHAALGEGYQWGSGIEGLGVLLQEATARCIPCIGETPETVETFADTCSRALAVTS